MTEHSFSLRLTAAAFLLVATMATPALALDAAPTTTTTTDEAVATATDQAKEADTSATTDAGTDTSAATTDDTAADKATSAGTTTDAAATGTATTTTTPDAAGATAATTPATGAVASPATPATGAVAGDDATATPDATTAATADPSAQATASAQATGTQATTDLQAGSSYTFVFQSAVQNAYGNYSRAVVEVAGGSLDSGANVRAWESNGTDAQRWIVHMDTSDTCRIENEKSGLFLDVYNGSAANGTNVWQFTGNGTKAQSWYIDWIDKSAGIVRFLSALDRNFALDLTALSTASGTNIEIWEKNDSGAQYWILRNAGKDASTNTNTVQAPSSSTATLPVSDVDGYRSTGYVITVDDGGVLDIAGGSIDAGGRAQTCTENDTPAQAYRITQASGGYYRLENMKSGMSLTASAWDVVPGTALTQQGSVDGDLNQLWVARSVNGRVVLVSAATGLAINSWRGTVTMDMPDNSTQQAWAAKTWSPALADYCYVFWSGVGNQQVLEMAGGSWTSGGSADTYASNGTPAQRWVVAGSNGSYTIRNVNSGLYLTAASNGDAIQSSLEGDASRWTISFVFSKGYLFVNKATGNALDVTGASSLSGTNVQTYAPNYTKAQGWQLVGCDMVDEGIYEFIASTDAARTLRLDVAGASDADGANVEIWGANGGDNQLWRVASVGNGWYRIFSASSGKALDVNNWGTADGTNVQQWTAANSSSTAQIWRFELGDHGLQLVSECNGKCLDVSGGSASWGANVQVWTMNGTAAQAWHLNPSNVSKGIDLFVKNLVALANDNSHGYDQTNRWGPDYDCSSYVITCLKNAGFDVGDAWYTGNMRAALVANGWEWITDISNTVFEPGDILLNEASHVGAMINNTEIAEAESNEFGGVTGGMTGDQTGSEILVHIFNVNYGGSFDGILRCTSRSKLA